MSSNALSASEGELARADELGTSLSNNHDLSTHDQPSSSGNPFPRIAESNISSSTESKQPLEPPLSKGRAIALVATVTGAGFLNILALQSVVIILPSIGESIGIPDSRLQWVVSAYSLTFGCFLLLWGRIADIYGKRLIFIGGSIWVTVVTAVNPFMLNEISFDLLRGLHGLGAAANVPTAVGILGVTFPPGKAKNYAFAAYGAGAPLGNVFGNILSGVVAEYADWKWVFGITAVLAAIISIAGFYLIPVEEALHSPTASYSSPMCRRGSDTTAKLPLVDWIGGFLITIGLIILLFALAQGNAVGWTTPWIPALIVISVIIILAFVAWQWYLERRMLCTVDLGISVRPPLMKVSMFRNLRFSAAMVIMTVFFASFNNFLVYATYYYQDFQGFSPLDTTLRFLPTGIGGIVVSVSVAFLLSRVPTVFILIGGTLSGSIACLLFAVPVPPETSYFAFALWAMWLAVVGADATLPCLLLLTSQELSPEDQATGGALINAVGQVGRAIGLAIATAVQTAVMASENGIKADSVGPVRQGNPASLSGIRAASWLSFGFGIFSLLVVVFAFRSMEVTGRSAAAARGEEEEEGIVNEGADTKRAKRISSA